MTEHEIKSIEDAIKFVDEEYENGKITLELYEYVKDLLELLNTRFSEN